MHEQTALVFTGGGRVAAVPPEGFGLVIAADSGLALAAALGRHVDVVVGDLDSVDPADLERAVAAGAVVERHDPDKDMTDLELALGAAAARGARRVHVAGGVGGRLDHTLANALCLAAPAWVDLELSAGFGAARVWVVRTDVAVTGDPGDLLSLVPVGGPAHGVRTAGLRWQLAGETLDPASGRGVSNELTETTATVSLVSGTLLAIAPGPEGGGDDL